MMQPKMPMLPMVPGQQGKKPRVTARHRAMAARFAAKKKPPLGSGGRFKALTQELASKGAKNPDALAAFIGRKKFGKARFQNLAAKGK